jgi:hypothetical protein
MAESRRSFAEIRANVAFESNARSAISAPRSPTGCAVRRIVRQDAASSIQTGISWARATSSPTRLQRATEPAALSITS